ncbi:MAG: hypothetical protein KDB00_23350 [Planctomycetales bacterium]|nr:hypothetical protein [Planctomycetales bacterium]
MTEKQPVILTVTIETQNQRWFVAGITLSGEPIELMCSEPGNLTPYVGKEFDEQVSFLRHRLSGVLQRGCDRLWGRMMKPCQIVFITDDAFADADDQLGCRVAEHFVQWMTRPPVVFYQCQNGWSDPSEVKLDCLAGTIDDEVHQAFVNGLPALVGSLRHLERWERASNAGK